MSRRGGNAVIGTGIGSVAEPMLTGGPAIGTVDGAAVGSFIGNQGKTQCR